MSDEREDAIREVVARLARPGRGGASVIERAAIMAEGADSDEIIRWILAHAGEPEAIVPRAATGGLHGGRSSVSVGWRPPSRYVLPDDALI